MQEKKDDKKMGMEKGDGKDKRRKASQAKPRNLGVGQEGVFSHNNNAKIKLTVATAARLFPEVTLKMSASSCMY